MPKFKIGDQVWGKYRGVGIVIEPSANDLSKPHFEDDICVEWNGVIPKTDWHGQSGLQSLAERSKKSERGE